MGKNMSADQCSRCGELIYYGGNNPCCKVYDAVAEEEIRTWERKQAELEKKREEAIAYIDAYYEAGMNMMDLFEPIWYASTEILPNLEVQVVVDAKDAVFISTGSAGYVEQPFGLEKGMTLPVKCWIHTHPFGSAYFSGTDINTVTIWEPIMETAYVLGGVGHYGRWSKESPKHLSIYRNFDLERIQTWGGEEE